MKTSPWIWMVPLAFTLGCPYAPPARTTGPSETASVRLAIAGQYCDEYDETDYEGWEAVEVWMKVAVTNRGNDRVEFDPDRLRLVASDRVTLSPVSADSALSVTPGNT